MEARLTSLFAREALAAAVKRDVVALSIAGRDPRVPFLAKAIAALVAAYALSPLDLIPDFIPVLGYLDDLILVPAGIMLAVRLIPAPLMKGFRAEAAARAARQPRRNAAHLIWAGSALLLIWLFWTGQPTSANLLGVRKSSV